MDINVIRSIATVLCFIALMGVFWWAYSPSRKARFDEDANMLFDKEGENTGNNNQRQGEQH